MEIEIYTENIEYTDKNDLLRIKDIYNRDKDKYETSISERPPNKDEVIMNFENNPNKYYIDDTEISIYYINSLDNIELKYDNILQTTDCFIIDEAQFFQDLVEFSKKWVKLGKILIIAGLSGDYKQEPFTPISNIIPLCDKIIHLTSNCSLCGNDAPFTKRLVEDKDQILIGNDVYQPRCSNCF